MISELRPGIKFRQYQLLEQIGVGGQGVVWSAVDQARDDIVAIKFNEIPDSDKKQADDMMFERQLDRLLKLNHAHVLPIYDYGLEGQLHYLVSPYVSGGSLDVRIKAGLLPPGDALRFAAETAAALDYLHGQGIIHRDLKASNILMDLSHHSYLADFGLARAVSVTTQAMHTGRGTPPYSPPEQHKLGEITPKSDVFSFGILLFELFTGHLPWDGERTLGILQLYSKTEIPNPLELNPRLPPLMWDVLRRVTSADPASRPPSAGEVMKALNYIFQIKDFPMPAEVGYDGDAARARDAGELLKQSLARWKLDEAQSGLGLTRFALMNLEQKKENKETSRDLNRFMLFNALTFGYDDEYWWSKVKDPGERLLVSSALLGGRNEAVAARVLDHLVRDPDIHTLPADLPGTFMTSLLEMAAKSTDPSLPGQLIAGLRALIPSPPDWNTPSSDPNQYNLLGNLALEDSEFGDEAAQLIGHLRAQPAVRVVLEEADENRGFAALLEIQRTAGSLPAFVGGSVRLRVFLEWIVQRLTAQPARLVGAYALAFLGAALGIATQVYLTYRLPEFMDIPRITSSLEQGLIIGTIFGLGIFLARLIVERFPGPGASLRVLLGTAAGAVGMNIAMFVFHVLFINTAPAGIPITLGCVLIALSFSIGGLIRRRWIKMLISITAVLVAIMGTWWVHRILAASLTDLTPLFRYDYTWSTTQVLLTAVAVALWMGIFGNLVPLSVDDE
jgi:serine/threonine protein kinase